MVVFDEKQWGDHQMHLKNRDDSQHQIGESGCTRLVSLRRTRPFFILWAWSGAKWHDPPAPVYWTAGVFFFSWLCGKRFLKVCRSLFRTTDFRIFRVLCGFASAGHIGWWPKPKHSLQRSSLGLPGKARIHAVQLICCGYTSILYTSTLLLFLPWRLGRNCNIALYKFEFAGAHWSRVSVAWCICCFPLGWDRWTLWAACGLVAHGTVCLQRVETCILSGWPCFSAVFRFSSLRPVISKLRHLAMAFQQAALLT